MPFGGSPPFADTHLGRAMATLHPTLVVDRPRPLHRHPRPLRPQMHRLPGAPGSWVLQPVALPASERPASAWASDTWMAWQIEQAARRVLPARRALVTFSPARGLLRAVKRELTVYWRRDLAAHRRYSPSPRHLRARNAELVRRADLVTAVSPSLVADSRPANPRAYLLPNGSDVAHFGQPARRPPNFPDVGPGPVLGYVGAVSWRVDLELLDELCALRPDWNVVLVGKVEGAVPVRRNLHAVGSMPYERLPQWTSAFDVGLVPYRLDDFNEASFPLKVFDYLASGVPVVATDLPALRDVGEPVRVAPPERFVDAVEATLREPRRPDRCRELAAANSWLERARQLDALMAEVAAPALRGNGQVRLSWPSPALR
jgi:teichuronic acid biosynthesis glycosyltransferase TuaH